MKLDTLEPDFRVKVQSIIDECATHGIKLVCTSCRRTIKEQDALFAIGRTVKGEGVSAKFPMGRPVTKAKGGQSPHNFGYAADVCPLDSHGNLWWNAPDDIWHAIHCFAENEGMLDADRIGDALDSGYDWNFKDAPHLEDPKWKEVQAAWRDGKVHVA